MKKILVLQLSLLLVFAAFFVMPADAADGNPVVKSMSRNSVKVGTITKVKINGKNFADGLSVQIGDAEEGITVTVDSVSKNGKRLNATLEVPPTVTPGRKIITVTNADNPDNPGISKKGVKVIKRPKPVVSKVTPSTVTQGETADITIKGNKFYSYGETMPTVSFGDESEITVNSVTVTNKKKLEANISVPISETVGVKAVTVSNPDGRSRTKSTGITVEEAVITP